MRQTYKGAAALAAICSAALAFGQGAVAADATIPGASGANGGVGRIAGVDRIQTSLQAATATTNVDRFYIVGYDNQVDALSLAPLNCEKKGYVLFVKKNGLEKRHVEALLAHPNADIYILGGTGAVSAKVEAQLQKLQSDSKILQGEANFARIGGPDRYDTAYQVGGFVADICLRAGAGVQDAYKAVSASKKAIQDYLDAQKNYTAKSKAYVAAVAAYKKAVLAQTAAFAALVKQTSKHIDVTQLKADLETAEDKLAKADKTAKANSAALQVIIDGLATTDFNLQDQDLKTVTLQDFIDKYNTFDEKKQKALKPVMDNLHKVIDNKLGKIAATDTLQEAITKAKTEIKALAKTFKESVVTIGKYYSLLLEKINAADNNSKITKDVALANNAYEAAVKAQKAAETAEGTAKDDLDKAIAALKTATEGYLNALRDLPGEQEDYRTAIDNAYTNTNAPMFVSDGVGFADALAAGPAAAKQKGIVLLSKGNTLPAATKKALDLSKSQSVAIGGPAARALAAAFSQAAVQVYGKDRYATAVEVAKRYFADGIVSNSTKQIFALASGENGADAMAASAYLTSIDNGGGVLLARRNTLPKVTEDFLAYGRGNQNQTGKYVAGLAVFGGHGALSAGVVSAAKDALNNR